MLLAQIQPLIAQHGYWVVFLIIMLESAGERGAMAIPNIDRPRVIADAILNTSKQDRKFL